MLMTPTIWSATAATNRAPSPRAAAASEPSSQRRPAASASAWSRHGATPTSSRGARARTDSRSAAVPVRIAMLSVLMPPPSHRPPRLINAFAVQALIGLRRPGAGTDDRRVNEMWMLDELAHAGSEHLDAGFIAGFDRKQGYPDAETDIAAFEAHGLGRASAVIDFGAGTGQFAIPATRHFGRVTAVDVSPGMLAALAAKAGAEAD